MSLAIYTANLVNEYKESKMRATSLLLTPQYDPSETLSATDKSLLDRLVDEMRLALHAIINPTPATTPQEAFQLRLDSIRGRKMIEGAKEMLLQIIGYEDMVKGYNTFAHGLDPVFFEHVSGLNQGVISGLKRVLDTNHNDPDVLEPRMRIMELSSNSVLTEMRARMAETMRRFERMAGDSTYIMSPGNRAALTNQAISGAIGEARKVLGQFLVTRTTNIPTLDVASPSPGASAISAQFTIILTNMIRHLKERGDEMLKLNAQGERIALNHGLGMN
jgi:hypothetical protein